MGHVDHGKTSLLDSIRRTKVIDSEAGGITQHIGAYQVQTSRGLLTFLDTPGHSAFTAMRARGASCTDIVILVVAADDGVMPQTIEAIQHSKAAGVPIIVAINKIDKPDADAERIINELSQYELIPESWGGDTIFCQVSAKEGMGIEELLEVLMLQAEVLELNAVATGPAQGVVIEARVDKGRGSVATLLVQQGQLKMGDMVLAGLEYGRIRAMIADDGGAISAAGPSVPVEVLGLSSAPNAGDIFQAVTDERKAREVALYRQGRHREVKLSKQQATKLEGFMDRMKNTDVKVLNIVLKADVQGSIEALADSLEKLSNAEIKVRVISKAVGGFNESDINLAIASEAILIGFNVRADASARKLSQLEDVEINYYSIIYDAINDIKGVLLGRLGPEVKEEILGLAEVKDVFRSSKIGAIAGCVVLEGKIKRGNPIRVLRNNVVVYAGELESLRRFKDIVDEVKSGTECGIGVKNYNDVKVGDQIEVFETVEIARKEL
jgi:translation initiation factor IF-2